MLKGDDDPKTEKNQYPAYALKSDNGKLKAEENQYPGLCSKGDDDPKTEDFQYPAYAVKSDDGN
jgi:hypothetical protein